MRSPSNQRGTIIATPIQDPDGILLTQDSESEFRCQAHLAASQWLREAIEDVRGEDAHKRVISQSGDGLAAVKEIFGLRGHRAQASSVSCVFWIRKRLRSSSFSNQGYF